MRAFHEPHYRCPNCGDASIAPVVCDRCDVSMVASAAPLAESRAPFVRRFWVREWIGPGVLGGVVVGLLLGFLMAELTSDPTWIFFYGPLVGGVLGASITTALGRRLARTRWMRTARDAFTRVAPARIRDAGEGQARVAGRATPLRIVTSPRGAACVACEWNASSDPLSVELYTLSADFELDDGSGARAIVRGAHVVVASGVDGVGEVLVPSGALVEVVGAARWRADDADAPGAGFRDAARVLELVGTVDDPVVIRVVPPDAPALAPPSEPGGTGVRVALGREVDHDVVEPQPVSAASTRGERA